MEIGIDISRIAAAARTGTEHYTYELLGALARCDHRNQYTLYCNQRPAALPPLGTNFSLRRIPLVRLWTHARLSAELLRHAPDVLFIPAHVIPLGAPLRHNTRLVVTIHDLGYLHFPQAHTRSQRLMLRLSTIWSARVANHIIAVSTATRDDLVRLTHVPPEKITVVHHGLSARFTPEIPSEAIDKALVRYGLHRNTETAPYFLYVGTVQPRKNLVRLIEAFAQLESHNLEQAGIRPQLVIAGKQGWLSQPIEQRATELGVRDRVHFTGYVDAADLPALMSGALAFVFPSLYEGFGLPVLEAMATGTPVLTSNTSSLPEVAGDAALLANPKSTAEITRGLLQLATDTALRARLRTAGLARAAQFTWERCAAETLQVLLK